MPEIEGVFLTQSETQHLASLFLRLASRRGLSSKIFSDEWVSQWGDGEIGITRDAMVDASKDELEAAHTALGRFRDRQFREMQPVGNGWEP